MAQYSFPSNLAGEADASLVAGLEYSCLTCATKCLSAEIFKAHIDGSKHKKKLEAASLSESADIQSQIAEYMQLEAPHRELNKAKKKEKFAAHLELKKGEQGMMTPEERAEKKRQAVEAGAGPAAKKAKIEAGTALYTCTLCNTNLNSEAQMQQHVQSPKHLAREAAGAGAAPARAGPAANKPKMQPQPTAGAAYTCTICNINLNSEAQMMQHVNGPKHLAKAEAIAGGGGAVVAPPKAKNFGTCQPCADPKAGCQACGLPGPLNKNHFESKAHLKAAGGGGVGNAAAAGTKKPKMASGAMQGSAAEGCAICGLPGPINQNHFESKKHKAAAGIV